MRKLFETRRYKHIDEHGKILDFIISFVKSKRTIVDPNPGFYKTLKEQEDLLVKGFID